MKDSDNYKEETNEHEKTKKQKAGLNAIRPDDYIERKFKDMAKDSNLSQTEMFNRIFWNYISDQKNERKQLALNLESEIELISNNLDNILQHFKSISDKAQNTIISIKTNAEQSEMNLTLNIDTLQKKIEELTNRNIELELSNNTFNEVKSNLETKIKEITENYNKKDTELEEAQEQIKDKDKSIKDMGKNIYLLEKNSTKSDEEIKRLQGDLNALETKIKSLEITNNSLTNTINSIDNLKKSEISSIDSKYQLIIAELELKLKTHQETKLYEIDQIQKTIKSQFDADKKMAIAEMKLELADIKTKYGEVLAENANLRGLLSKEN